MVAVLPYPGHRPVAAADKAHVVRDLSGRGNAEQGAGGWRVAGQQLHRRPETVPQRSGNVVQCVQDRVSGLWQGDPEHSAGPGGQVVRETG